MEISHNRNGQTEYHRTALSLNDLRQIIRHKWPEALCSLPSDSNKDLVFKTGLAGLDTLFSLGGIPYGQLIEITGPASCGKTSLLLRLLAGWSLKRTITYVDFGHSFFPEAARLSGVDLNQLLIIKPDRRLDDFIRLGIRTAELLLRGKITDLIVFDLVGQRTKLPLGLLHRLRLRIVRAKGLIIFLTQEGTPASPPASVIPSSMASLCLKAQRIGNLSTETKLEIAISKSRIAIEKTRVEVSL